jgi:hypothetical protein
MRPTTKVGSLTTTCPFEGGRGFCFSFEDVASHDEEILVVGCGLSRFACRLRRRRRRRYTAHGRRRDRNSCSDGDTDVHVITNGIGYAIAVAHGIGYAIANAVTNGIRDAITDTVANADLNGIAHAHGFAIVVARCGTHAVRHVQQHTVLCRSGCVRCRHDFKEYGFTREHLRIGYASVSFRSNERQSPRVF